MWYKVKGSHEVNHLGSPHYCMQIHLIIFGQMKLPQEIGGNLSIGFSDELLRILAMTFQNIKRTYQYFCTAQLLIVCGGKRKNFNSPPLSAIEHQPHLFETNFTQKSRHETVQSSIVSGIEATRPSDAFWVRCVGRQTIGVDPNFTKKKKFR